MVAYCARCRRQIEEETYNFWQGTAWCENCRSVVRGTFCKVPIWVLTATLLLALRLNMA